MRNFVRWMLHKPPYRPSAEIRRESLEIRKRRQASKSIERRIDRLLASPGGAGTIYRDLIEVRGRTDDRN